MVQANDVRHSSTYARILVGVDLGPEAGNRIKLAAGLAQSFSSRLIGVAAEEILPPLYFEFPSGLEASAVELQQRQAADELAKAGALFQRSAGTGQPLEWHSAFGLESGFVESFVSRYARAADLVVVSRQGALGPEVGRMDVDPGQLVMIAGRPVLVVPPGKDTLSAQRIVVAWKDTREGRRAVSDALPLLKRAERVFVVTVGPDEARQGADDVGAYLADHGVANEVVARPQPAGTVAAELIAVAQQQAADLIVSGAYGHSRTREWAFGGVTHELLKTAPVCCLMTH